MAARIHRLSASRNAFQRPAPPTATEGFEGVLLVDKPAGPTSHDIVDAVRAQFRIKKVGHGGTLDPQATGLLILLLGRATKLSNRFLGSDKAYEGSMHLGVSTTSFDAQGEVTGEADPGGVTEAQLRAEMSKFAGDIYQTPPMVSAVKVDGVPLHKMARKGKTVERKARIVHIYDFRLDRFELPYADFRVRCSKGTYVRSLCAEVGDGLGCGAHLCYLRRTRSGALKVDDAHGLQTIMEWTREELETNVISMKTFV